MEEEKDCLVFKRENKQTKLSPKLIGFKKVSFYREEGRTQGISLSS